VNGGTTAGKNTFHRLSELDTRSGVRSILVDAKNRQNLFFAVSSPTGSFINKPIHLTSPANLFLLSPGGLWVGRGAEFFQATNLLLSTGVSIDLPGGRFHAISSTSEGLLGLGSSPELPLNLAAVPGDLRPLVIGPAGAPLVINRAVITGNQSVMLDASLGHLSISDSQIDARKALRLSGGAFALTNVDLSSGTAGKRGPIAIYANSNLPQASGIGALTESRLTGNQISIAAGDLSLQNVHISAPKGWVDLYARNPAGQAAGLRIVDSSINLSPNLAEDLWSPQIIYGAINNSTMEAKRNPTPHIGLFSAGGISVERSTLDASLLLPASADTSFTRILEALPAKAGVIVAESMGNIRVVDSTLRSDASHGMSGGISMEAGRELFGQPALGSLAINNSLFSASGGAGYGLILLQSNNGLSVKESTLQSVVDRSPQLPGDKHKTADAYAFRGGRITLNNRSNSKPLEVASSHIVVNHHTSGGTLRSPFYGEASPDGKFISFGGQEFALNKGYAFSYAGGFIQLYSKGGVAISENSFLDASSRNPLMNQLEGLGGQIVVASSGSADLQIQQSRLEARSGDSLGTYQKNLKAGMIYITGEGNVRLHDASIDLTRGGPLNSKNVAVPDPYLAVKAGGNLQISGRSTILAQSSAPRPRPSRDPSVPFYGIRLSDSSIKSRGMPDTPHKHHTQAELSDLAGNALGGVLQANIGEFPGTLAAGDSSSWDSLIANFTTPVGTHNALGPSYVSSSVATTSRAGYLTSWEEGMQSLSDALHFRRIASDSVRFDQALFVLQDDGVRPDQLFSYFDELVVKNRQFFLDVYTASSVGQASVNPIYSFVEAPRLLALGPPVQPAQVVGLALPVLTPGEDTENQLLEGQQQSLTDVVASLGLPVGSGRVQSVEELQQHLRRITSLRAGSLEDKRLASEAPYRPAIVQLSLEELPDNLVQLTAILLTASGDPVSRSTVLPKERFQSATRAMQTQLARRQFQPADSADAPSALLASWLLAPIAEPLRASGANALLLAVDRGLQAIPYAALPFGQQPLGQYFALSISPSLGLLDLDSRVTTPPRHLLAAGASTFAQPLDPLPMVPREVQALAAELPTTVLLDDAFTPDALRQQAAQDRHGLLHIATHADFQPGQSDGGRLFTRQGSLSLAELGASLRSRNEARPLDLITLSACHTALGDEQSELGFVGMALQAGARSALGSLWEVDDSAAAAFFVQYYRYLHAGFGKDQALQATAAAFRSGRVRLEGDFLVGPRVRGDGDASLVAVVGMDERERLAAGLSHPYFWAGMVLTGSPW
jgi:CHAT domain-containing protein